MKLYAPKNFRWKHIKFALGYINATEEQIKLLQTVPIEIAEIKNRKGRVINAPTEPKPESHWLKKDIQLYCDNHDIPYTSSNTKSQLLSKINK